MSGLSAELRRFVAETPLERESILAAAKRLAEDLPSDSRVLDAGSGDAPFRELFTHCRYTTADWESSQHPGARYADIVGSLDAIAVPDCSFDAVLCTQVLEHVADPSRVLGELWRVLRPAGQLCLTAPLVWPLHEEPYDFFRYTSHGLRSLLEGANFRIAAIEPRSGYFATLGALAMHSGGMVGTASDGRNLQRKVIAVLLRLAARPFGRLDRLDTRRTLPLGYVCWATRPALDAEDSAIVAPVGT